MQLSRNSYNYLTLQLPPTATLPGIMKILQHLIPYFFEKEPIPAIADSDLKQRIKEVKQQPDALQAMQYALDLLAARYDSKAFDSVFHDP